MTTSLAYKTSQASTAPVRRVDMPEISFVTRSTPPPINIAEAGREYTDEQFLADLNKSGGWVDRMGDAALEEHAKGKTRKLP